MTGPELRAIRLQLGLTLAEFGRALGYTGKCGVNISQMENGKRTITPQIERIAIMFADHGIYRREWRQP